MQKSAANLVDLISSTMEKDWHNMISFTLSDFYTFSGRTKIKESFLKQVDLECKQHNLVFACGQAAVFFIKDFNSAPIPSIDARGTLDECSDEKMAPALQAPRVKELA